MMNINKNNNLYKYYVRYKLYAHKLNRCIFVVWTQGCKMVVGLNPCIMDMRWEIKRMIAIFNGSIFILGMVGLGMCPGGDFIGSCRSSIRSSILRSRIMTIFLNICCIISTPGIIRFSVFLLIISQNLRILKKILALPPLGLLVLYPLQISFLNHREI